MCVRPSNSRYWENEKMLIYKRPRYNDHIILLSQMRFNTHLCNVFVWKIMKINNPHRVCHKHNIYTNPYLYTYKMSI